MRLNKLGLAKRRKTMTTMVLENLNGNLLERFKQLAIETGVKFSITPTEQVKDISLFDDKLPPFNKALLLMPRGNDNEDIFVREPSMARDIDLSD